MPESDEEVQRRVEEVFGFKPCLWQICVARAVLAGEDVITVAPTGSGKSLTYWIPLLYIKHGITIVVSPLKLLGTQFARMLEDNRISAISITAANATNELFEVMILIEFFFSFLITKGQNLIRKQYHWQVNYCQSGNSHDKYTICRLAVLAPLRTCLHF